MTVSLTTRLGLTRWSSDADAWSREQFDANFGALEELAVIGTQGTNAARPAAGVARRLYVATDAERVYLDDGDEWYELLVGGVANASAVVFTPAGNIAANVAATTVQAAIDELDTEKAPKASPTFTGTTTTGTLAHGAGALLGFYGTAPVARPGTYNLNGAADRTLGAYASDPETAAYTGAADGEAKLADLNSLRAAYENLRTYVEDLAGVVVGTATDLKTLGLVG